MQIVLLLLPSKSGPSVVIKVFDYLRLIRLLRVIPLIRRVSVSQLALLSRQMLVPAVEA